MIYTFTLSIGQCLDINCGLVLLLVFLSLETVGPKKVIKAFGHSFLMIKTVITKSIHTYSEYVLMTRSNI